ncbi:hypothetical protein PF010_g960 [Phytophthora fragariae]|uniref:Uncharacterized protein n=2 Tax=Phytophthora fragariae TaxID=53985 RepID=A0A6G0M2B4_9STRA|nr:hypothetical protein PF010_g960 [Phytophthora fragariae]
MNNVYCLLDEADRLLDVPVAEDLSFIFDKLPAKMLGQSEDKWGRGKKNYMRSIHEGKKDQSVEQLLKAATSSPKCQLRSMTFVSTCEMCELVGNIGSNLGTKSVTLYSMMPHIAYLPQDANDYSNHGGRTARAASAVKRSPS